MRIGILTPLVLVVLACQRTQPRASMPLPSGSTQPLDTGSAYRAAIADYITAMDTSGSPMPDTVYIGRHAEFPRIELPAVIARRTVRIVDPVVGESEKHLARFAYLNIFASFSPGTVEFYAIRFAQGLRHQPDGSEDRHLYYRMNEKAELVLERVDR